MICARLFESWLAPSGRSGPDGNADGCRRKSSPVSHPASTGLPRAMALIASSRGMLGLQPARQRADILTGHRDTGIGEIQFDLPDDVFVAGKDRGHLHQGVRVILCVLRPQLQVLGSPEPELAYPPGACIERLALLADKSCLRSRLTVWV